MDSQSAVERTGRNLPNEPNKKVRPNKIVFDGDVGQITVIWLINALLNIPTLGIYSFWGKTRMRRYITGAFSVGGDRFAYLGTGKELFFGFLRALPILALVFAPFILSEFYEEANDMPLWLAFWTLLAIPSLLYFLQVARYMALRYRLSRLSWRGIRGYMAGSAFAYGWYALWRGFLNVITFGIMIPFSDIKKFEYQMNNARFGNLKAHYTGRGANIFGSFILSIMAGFGVLVVCMILFAIPIAYEGIGKANKLIEQAKIEEEQASAEEEGSYTTSPYAKPAIENEPVLFPDMDEDMSEYPDDEESEEDEEVSAAEVMTGLMFIFSIIIAIAGFKITGLIYKAALIREKFNGLRIGHIRFRSAVTFGKLFGLGFGNLIIMIFTMGFGKGWVIQRQMKFMADNTLIGGDLDSEEIQQAQKQQMTFGEGLDDALGIDSGIM